MSDTSPTPADRDGGGRTDLRRPVRLSLVGLFLLVSVLGLLRSQTYAMDAVGPSPGVWPRWAFWPALVLLGLVLTQQPSSWPTWGRRAAGVAAVVTFAFSAIALDAAVGRYVLTQQTGTVTQDVEVRRSVHRVGVAVDGGSVTAYSPAASFAGQQHEDSTTGNRHYEPGSAYGETAPYEKGDTVTVQVDPEGTWQNRIVPVAGQAGHLSWFPRTAGVVGAATAGLALGWGLILVICAGVALRGERH